MSDVRRGARRDGAPLQEFTLALAHRFVEADGAGHADVQALDRTEHGNAHELIAGLARQAAHALALSAHDPRHRTARIHLVHALTGLVVGADQPDIAFFQLAHGAREVGYGQVGNGVGGAASHALHGGVQAHGAVARRNDRMHAGGIRRAQAGAQIVRVRHAVQDQQQRRPLDHVEHLVDAHRQAALLGHRHHALVPGAARQAVEPLGRHRMHAAAGPFGLLQERLHALVAPRRLDIDFLDRLGRVAQARNDRVKPRQNLGRRHE
ncbi:hypothetical protein FR5810_00087 [Bordetella pertussis]|nr:hypothetical protein FR5810_00087 [Bordetella pertussis]